MYVILNSAEGDFITIYGETSEDYPYEPYTNVNEQAANSKLYFDNPIPLEFTVFTSLIN